MLEQDGGPAHLRLVGVLSLVLEGDDDLSLVGASLNKVLKLGVSLCVFTVRQKSEYES